MLLSKIQGIVASSVKQVIKYSTVSSSYSGFNKKCGTSYLIMPLNKMVIQSELNAENLRTINQTDAISQDFISNNLLDQLSSLTLYPKSITDFKSYRTIDTTVLDTVNLTDKIDFPVHTHNSLEIDDCFQNTTIQDANQDINTPMKLHKGDLYWRRRRMRRHRLLRWRKRYKRLVLDRLQKRLANREEKQKQDLRSAWQAFGLNNEPPQLTNEEIKRLTNKWEEQGILIGLNRDEMLSFFRHDLFQEFHSV